MLLALLSRGYFPAELPPPFWSDPFGGFAAATPQFIDQDRERGQSVAHNIPRAGHARRRLDIPNPPHFAKLARLLAEEANWQTIQQHTRGSKFSVTWPRCDHTGHRALTYRCSYPQVDALRLWNRAGRRYVLLADVQRYYHSVYTHSIPWVLHTKSWSKSNPQAPCLGNDADRFIRNSQDGQTIGIPIGPDSSLVIAEILLSHVDSQLHDNLGLSRGIRFMDEWEFAFERVAEAETARAAIEDALSFLELELNPVKVSLSEGPVPLHPQWVTRLRALPLPRDSARESDLITLFDTAFELSHEYRTKGVLNWAISRTMSSSFNWAGWKSLEPLLLQSAASEPGSVGRCLRMICIAIQQGHSPHQERVAEALQAIIQQGATRSHWSEVAWALWGHILLGIPLDTDEAAKLAGTDDPIVALCALDAHHRGLVSEQNLANAIQRWTGLAQQPSALDSRDWLLTYEAAVKNWLPLAANPLAGDVHYEPMAAAGVHFYRQQDPTLLMMRHKHSAPPFLTPPLGYP